jgi:hypothetical protein
MGLGLGNIALRTEEGLWAWAFCRGFLVFGFWFLVFGALAGAPVYGPLFFSTLWSS